MSTRRGTPGLIVALASVCLIASGGAFAVSACSSSSTPDNGSTDASTDVAPDTHKIGDGSVDPDSGTLTPAQCKAKCKADHPNASAKEAAIDTCWADSCQAPCVDKTGVFDGGADGGADADVDGGSDAGGGGLVCGTQVTSGIDTACDQCTEAYCCTSWKACYGDPDCLAYDQCLGDCNPGP